MFTTCKKLYQFFWGGLTYDPGVFLRLLYHFVVPTRPTPVQEISTEEIVKSISEGKSFIRLGDGEMMILTGRDVYFQQTSRDLARGLTAIYKNYNDNSGYMLGVPTNKLPLPESALTPEERRVWRLYRILFSTRFPLNFSYASATFFYIGGRFKSLIEPIIKNRHVICVSNAQVLDEAFRTYATTTFAHASFIITPTHNALAEQEHILKAIEETLHEHKETTPIILFAAGPASKAWAYQYAKRGIQCLDIGHGMQLIAHDGDRSSHI